MSSSRRSRYLSLFPRRTLADGSREPPLDALPFEELENRAVYRLLDALTIAMQDERGRAGWAYDLRMCADLSRATRGDEAMWSGMVQIRRGPHLFTHLMHAVSDGDADRTKWLIARGAPLELKDDGGCTALYHAAWQGQDETLALLLDAGANVNAAADDGDTPLREACRTGPVSTVCILLRAGANPARASLSLDDADVRRELLEMSTTMMRPAATADAAAA